VLLLHLGKLLFFLNFTVFKFTDLALEELVAVFDFICFFLDQVEALFKRIDFVVMVFVLVLCLLKFQSFVV
jgi:hypothetical protein